MTLLCIIATTFGYIFIEIKLCISCTYSQTEGCIWIGIFAFCLKIKTTTVSTNTQECPYIILTLKHGTLRLLASISTTKGTHRHQLFGIFSHSRALLSHSKINQSCIFSNLSLFHYFRQHGHYQCPQALIHNSDTKRSES